jgi:hypothetical protein
MAIIHFGTYDLYPCIYVETEGWIHHAWIYVDDHWNRIRLEPWTAMHEVHAMEPDEFLKHYSDIGTPFSALAQAEAETGTMH